MRAITSFACCSLAAALTALAAPPARAMPPGPVRVVRVSAAGMRVASRSRGSCWTASIASRRSDAFRCMTGNAIHDPCFRINPRSVACPSDTTPTRGVRLDLTKPLPAAQQAGPPNVWMMRLAGGIACNLGTGTVVLGFPFYCSGGLVCAAPSGNGDAVRCGKAASAVRVTGIARYRVTTLYM